MRKKIMILGLLLVGVFANVSSKNEKAVCVKSAKDSGTIVFDNAKSTIPYRIPAIGQTRKGQLIAACDYRHNKNDVGWRDGNGVYRVDIVMKTSNDHGLTWSDTVSIARGNDHAIDTTRTAFGDPSIVADRTSDEVLVHCVSGKINYGRATRQNPQHAIFFHSTDGGQTWDAGTDLTNMIYGLYEGKLPNGRAADGIFLTSGRIMQSRYIKKNKYYRLYMAHPIRQNHVPQFGTYVIYSDDFGRSWHSLGDVKQIPSIAQDESKVEELPDGSVLLSCRNVYGGRRFNVFTYTDAKKAEGSWGKEVMPQNMTGKQVNACNGEVLVVPAKRVSDGRKLYVALQSVPLSATRDSVGFFYKELASYADYSTPLMLAAGWQKGLRVTDESSCYSTMIKMDNDRIAFLYETRLYNNGFDIVFKDLDLKEITQGKYVMLSKENRSQYIKDAKKALRLKQSK
ncbi:MAG: sialidase family protein [Prevotella sp.]